MSRLIFTLKVFTTTWRSALLRIDYIDIQTYIPNRLHVVVQRESFSAMGRCQKHPWGKAFFICLGGGDTSYEEFVGEGPINSQQTLMRVKINLRYNLQHTQSGATTIFLLLLVYITVEDGFHLKKTRLSFILASWVTWKCHKCDNVVIRSK